MDPSGVYLKDSIDDSMMYFPRENGEFKLSEDGVLPYSTLQVEGLNFVGSRTPTRTTPTANSILTQSSSTSNPSGSSTPIGSSTSYHGTSFRPVLARRPVPSHTIKVVQAKMNKGRKITFETLDQLHIHLTESTANVDSVVSTIQQAWGSDHIIVTSDGLRIDNSPATRGILICTVCSLVYYFIITGLAFWKVPSRKLYAVKQTDLEPREQVDGNDDELTPRGTKRFRKEIKEGVHEIKEEFRTLQSLLLPNCLRDQMLALAKCCICQVIIQPPVLMANCCNSIVGCEQCILQMHASGDSPACPLCRDAEFPTTKLNGFNEFLSALCEYMDTSARTTSQV